jgi:Holliday junction resolvase RusA-like endonuclease
VAPASGPHQGAARSVEFFVPGAAVGKQRPIAGRSFGTGFTKLRTPEKTVNYEGLVGWTASQAMKGTPLFDGAVHATITICCAVPASWSGVKQQRALTGVIRPTTKPDMDNVLKALFDAMNGVVFKDDVQVVSLTAAKRYSDSPGVWVRVQEAA